MSTHSGRNAPEWFGGDNGNIANSTSSRGSKKKNHHRRSKSDTSHLKSSTRKAAEREQREQRREREKSNKEKVKNKKHRRGKSRGETSANSLFLEENSAHAYSHAHSSLKAPRMEGPIRVAPSILTGDEGREHRDHRDHRKKKPTHTRSKTAPSLPSLQKKKSTGFFERIFGFGRSEPTTAPSDFEEPLSTGELHSSLHFHVHKIEEKIDPEELRLLAPPPSAPLRTATNEFGGFAPMPPKVHNQITYHQPHLNINHPSKAYSQTSLTEHSGAESDDLLTYSDDDTAGSISFNPYQQPPSSTSLYPSYHDYTNHESYQLMQQQRLMALSQAQFATKAMNKYGIGNVQNGNTYGSINRTTAELLPPLQQKPQRQGSFPNFRRVDSNDMYVSEDETLTSAHTQETYRNVDNFYFDRISTAEKIPTSALIPPASTILPFTNENEHKLLLGPMHEEIRISKSGGQDTSPNSVNDLLDITEHKSNLNLAKLNETTEAMMEQLSMKSNSYKEEINSASSGSCNMKTPPQQTHSHSSKSTKGHGSTKQPKHKESHPPPPISSVQIIRSSATTETTVASVSSSSPHIPRIQPCSSSSSQHMQLMSNSRLSRKERKRLQKKIDHAEKIEDHLQFLLHGIDSDLFDLSANTSEKYANLDPGFFPTRKSSRNVFFSILFLMQLSYVIFLASRYAGGTILQRSSVQSGIGEYSEYPYGEEDPFAYAEEDPFSTGSLLPEDNISPISTWAKDIYVDYTNALQLSCITALYSTVLAALAIGMMMILSTAFIPTVLCVTIITCIVAGILIMALSPYTVMPVVALAALAISIAYSIVVWDRIPFATTNLHTALVGIKSSADILLAGFAMMIIAFCWTMTWMVAFLGIYDHYLDNADHELKNNITWVGLSVSFAMLISYVWTFNVIQVSRKQKSDQ